MEHLFSISELANEFSTEKDAILFYEKKRLLFSGKKRVTGLAYSEFDKFRLKFIVNAKNADYALGDIESLIGKIDPAKPEERQLTELINYGENKFNELKQSLSDMDMLEQINVTCDMELLSPYLKDIHTLKSRSAVSDFNRLKLIKTAPDQNPTPKLLHKKPIQQVTTKQIEPVSDSTRVKYLQRGLYAAIALLLLMIGVYFLSFMGLRPSSSQRSLSQEKSIVHGRIQQETNTPESLAPVTPDLQKETGVNDISESFTEVETSDNAAEDTITVGNSGDTPIGIMEETVMERNKEIFARVYRDTGATVSSNTTTGKPGTNEAPASKSEIELEKAINPMPQDNPSASKEDTENVSITPRPANIETQTQTILKSIDTSSPAVSIPSDSATPEEITASAAMATFLEKVSEPPEKSEPSTPKVERKSKPAANKSKPAKKNNRKRPKKNRPGKTAI